MSAPLFSQTTECGAIYDGISGSYNMQLRTIQRKEDTMKLEKLLNYKFFITLITISMLLKTVSEYFVWFREMYTTAYMISIIDFIVLAVIFLMIVGMILVITRNRELPGKEEIIKILISICVYLIYSQALTFVIYGVLTLAE